MSLNNEPLDGKSLLQAPHIINNEMISFRKSVDQRPSRSVLSSPNPYSAKQHLIISEQDSTHSNFSHKTHGISAVDKYTPISSSESNAGSFFGSEEVTETYPNSVYETIMNTQNKDWFQRPATYEVPQVKLIHGDNMDFMKDDEWRKELKGYLSVVTPLFKQFEELNDIEVFDENGTAKDIPLFFQELEFALEDAYYIARVKELVTKEHDNNSLLRLLKDLSQKINHNLNEEIIANREKFKDIDMEIQSIKKKLDFFEKDLESKLNANKIMLEKEIVKDEVLLNMELRCQNVSKLELKLSEIELLINKITSLCDEYHDKSEKKFELLTFENMKKHMSKITFLENELKQNILFIEIPFLKQKKEILMNLKLEIGGKILLQFVKLLMDDLESYLNLHFEDQKKIKFIMDEEADWPPLKFNDDFKFLLKEYIENLSASDSLINSYQLYCEKIINTCRDLVKQNLPKPNENEAVVLKMSQLIRNMSPKEFQSFVETVFSRSLIYFKRLYEQQKMLLDFGINALDTSKLDANVFLKLDIRSGINESMRIIQLRMSKIINCRSDLNVLLDFESFLKLRVNMINFSRRCEQLTGEILTLNLNDVIVVHTDEYQKMLHIRLSERLKQFIEQKEDWSAVLVDAKVQKTVNDIFLSAELIPSEWIVTMVDDSFNHIKSADLSCKKSIIVNDKTFVASNTLIEVIKIIKEIMMISCNLPTKYCSNLEHVLLKILGEFDKFSLTNLISNPSILNTHVDIDSIVSLNNNNNINVNSIIFKNKEKNYTILAEAIECIRELLPNIEKFFNNRDKHNSKLVKSTNKISHRTNRTISSKLYQNLLKNFQNSATLIYKCNIPPPSETSSNKKLSSKESSDKKNDNGANELKHEEGEVNKLDSKLKQDQNKEGEVNKATLEVEEHENKKASIKTDEIADEAENANVKAANKSLNIHNEKEIKKDSKLQPILGLDGVHKETKEVIEDSEPSVAEMLNEKTDFVDQEPKLDISLAKKNTSELVSDKTNEIYAEKNTCNWNNKEKSDHENDLNVDVKKCETTSNAPSQTGKKTKKRGKK
ncbi:hypothetical protein QEN19_001007 [Hanseniaspora menglaensis]